MSGGQIRAAETKGGKNRKAKRRFVKTGGVFLLEGGGVGWGGVVLVVGGLGGSVKTTGLFYDLKRGLKWPEMNTKLQLKGIFLTLP